MKKKEWMLFFSAIAISGCANISDGNQSNLLSNLSNMALNSFTDQPQKNLAIDSHSPVMNSTFSTENTSNEALIDEYNKMIKFGHAASFERHNEGLQIDGKLFIDPEGEIISFGADSETGNFTYLIKQFNGNYRLKAFRMGSDSSPIVLANIASNQRGKNIELITGDVLQGEVIIPVSDGLLVVRGQSIFRYRIGSPISSTSFSNEYQIAPLQKGDISGTGYILLEKKGGSNENDLFSSMQSLTRAVGLTKKFDYVLMNIDNRDIIPLNIDNAGKNIHTYSNCVKKNDFINECSTFTSHESLYTKAGLKNHEHYYWAIDWVNTKSGTFAFYNNGMKVFAIDVKNNKKEHELFSRLMGINEYEVNKSSDVISIQAKLGFSSSKIDNLFYFIENKSIQKNTATES